MKYLFLLLFGCLTFSACDEDFFSTTLQIDPPPHEPQLAVHSILTDTDTTFAFASVSETLGWFESDDFVANRLDDAEVAVFKDGAFLFRFEPFQDFPNYLRILDGPIGSNGSLFELRVTHPTLGTATATQQMPNPVPVTKVKNLGAVILGEELNIGTGVEIEFTDPPGVANYYEIELVAKMTTGGISNNIRLYSADPNVSNIWNDSKLVMSDAAIDGQSYKLVIQTDEERGLVLVWNSVTEEYYNYVRRLELQDDSAFNPFAEPVSITTNIEDGLGLFGLRAQLRYDVPPE